MRGGELVLENFCKLFPNADVFTLFYEPGKVSKTISSHRVFPSSLNRNPLFRKSYNNLLFLFPYVTEQFDLREYDCVLSSDTISMKGVITSPDTCHICYCHTPPRYVWDMYLPYIENSGFGRVKKLLAKILLHNYRAWDSIASSRVDYFVANSNFVARRIAKFYRRHSAVINPPARIDQFSLGSKGRFYLALGQLVPYKRIDILVDAFRLMPDKELVIAGTGPTEKTLKAQASGNIKFVGKVSESEKENLYKNCKAFLFPGVEDYGITPIEAQACGKPVIAYARGGVLDTVTGYLPSTDKKFDTDTHTGLFFEKQDAKSVVEAIVAFEKDIAPSYSPEKIRLHASKFSEQRFQEEVRGFVERCINEFAEFGPPTR